MRRVMATVVLASLVFAGCVEDTPDAPEGSGDPWPTQQAPLSQASVDPDAGNAPPSGSGSSSSDPGSQAEEPADEGPADEPPASDTTPPEDEPVEKASDGNKNATTPAANDTSQSNTSDTSNPPPAPVLREVYNRTHQFTQGGDARTDSIAVPAGTKVLTFNLTTSSGTSTVATEKDVRVYDPSVDRRATCAATCGLVIDDPAPGIWTVVYGGSSTGSASVTIKLSDAGFANGGKPIVLYDRDHDHTSARASSESFVVLPGAKLLEVNMTEVRAFGALPLDVSVAITVYDPDGKSQYQCTFDEASCTSTFTPTKPGVWLVSYSGTGSTKTHATITAR